MSRKDYIVKYVVVWGIPTGLLFFMYNQLTDWWFAGYAFTGYWIIDFVIAIITFTIAGGVLGYMMWKSQSKHQSKGDHNA
ncbi:hypothetical protein [Alkalibacillus haloalkaliphilus]|uniref:hypothetical protein n=1 Tax=Alkalibacillus haloalkaliphilus TaxID=94136 RepID=UPI002935D262|nr:hypothetical protein [Alkalibacillus haloalkaliphilus]MDV2582348.1 hypothetical protein [Alkalibacillus haloalkaliphilus]